MTGTTNHEYALLTPEEMGEADRLSIRDGPYSGPDLMNNAGSATTAEILAKFGDASRYVILCGPGNNGGDGYVVARLLAEVGATVVIHSLSEPKKGTDARLAKAACPITDLPIGEYDPLEGDVVVDALFGAGLDRPLSDPVRKLFAKISEAGCEVIAVDLPSGVSGRSGHILGAALKADLTVTFFRKKPGHLLYPGRELCGTTTVADIGIGSNVLNGIKPKYFENRPGLWGTKLPNHRADTHKYSRGGVAVFSGGPSSTGAARLAARAASRSGAGAVTVLSPPTAMMVNACHLTSIMVKPVDDPADAADTLSSGKYRSTVIGPGFGLGNRLRQVCLAVLAIKPSQKQPNPQAIILDADALTEFSSSSEELFSLISDSACEVVLTPHEGEFSRLFPDLAADYDLSKLERAKRAAQRSAAIVVLKGPDTVIASPGGMSAINTNGSIILATAGSGDVLAGTIAGLSAQGMVAFDAACAAVWLHGEAGKISGIGSMAEDIADALGAAREKLAYCDGFS